MPRTITITLGDVYEVQTPRGLGSVQVTHVRTRVDGYAVRLIQGLHPERPDDLATVVQGATLNRGTMDLKHSIRRGSFVRVGTFPIPTADQAYVFLLAVRDPDTKSILYWVASDDERRWEIHGCLPDALLRGDSDNLYIDMPNQSFRWMLEHQYDLAQHPDRIAYQQRCRERQT